MFSTMLADSQIRRPLARIHSRIERNSSPTTPWRFSPSLSARSSAAASTAARDTTPTRRPSASTTGMPRNGYSSNRSCNSSSVAVTGTVIGTTMMSGSRTLRLAVSSPRSDTTPMGFPSSSMM